MVPVAVGQDLQGCRDRVKPFVALYVGGMGAPGANFYHALVRRYGFGQAAERIQELYLSGRRRAAAAAVPDALVDELALLGTPERIRDRLQVWGEAGVTTLLAQTDDVEALRLLCGALDGEVSR
jgi:alkanesulfonate monooxygenase SsuD/methylene tetrahydromethanopterin reductase-like flavin-dependent oxidoreductase (luciferase family)